MKKRKYLIISLLMCMLLAIVVGFAACGTDKEEHKHVWGEWVLDVEPTLTEKGHATRTCKTCDKGTDGIEVAELTDTTVWTYDEENSTEPTHTEKGKGVYVSEDFGTVTIDIDEVKHTWGEWVVDKKPTLKEKGHATRTCTEDDDGEDEIEVPELSDATVWTFDEAHSEAPTHLKKGTSVYVSDDFGTVTIEVDPVQHTWGKWKIDQKPTLTEKGHATRTCTEEDGGEDGTEVPELSDTSVWTYDEENSTEPTHIQKGEGVYVSEDFGTVTIDLDIVGEHEMTDWAWPDGEPTESEGATATRHCTIPGCTEEETADVPALTDTSVWSVSEVAADYNHAGGKEYTSEYGTFLVKTADKLVAPYDNQSYGAYEIQGISGTEIRSSLYRYVWNTTGRLALDGNGVGTGRGGAFTNNATFVFTMVDDETGEILIRETKTDGTEVEYKGYVDFETGIVIMALKAGTSLITHYILSPYPFSSDPYSDVVGSLWGVNLLDYAIAQSFSYTKDEASESINIFVVNDVAYFGVTFTSISGDPINAENVKGSAQVLVKKGETLIGAYGWDGTKMVELDGLQGTWTGTVTGQGPAEVTLSGYGTFEGKLNGTTDIAGTYVIREDGKLDLYVNVAGAEFY